MNYLHLYLYITSENDNANNNKINNIKGGLKKTQIFVYG